MEVLQCYACKTNIVIKLKQV